MTTRVAGRDATLAAVMAIGLLLGCGDSAASDDGPGGEMPECLSPGALGMCICETTMTQGTRSCQDDGTWTDCSCPPPNGDPNACREGTKWMCPPCPPATEGELVVCPASGMIVCCGGGGDGGVVTDGMVPTPVDAGQDSGQDAATSVSDAG